MSESRCTPVIALRGSTAADPLAERDDEALMALSASDYRPAFEVLVGRYLLRLTNYCAKFLGCSRTGEELAQEVLIEVWGQRHRYLSVGRFSVFLFTLARNRCLNQARSERRRRRKGSHHLGETLSAEAAVQGPDQLDLLLEQERQRRVWTALRALPTKLREAVLLRFDQELEYADISRIVNRSESTVRSRVFLAMKRLRQEVGGGSDE